MKKLIIILIVVMIFLISNVSALTLKLSPSPLKLYGEPNTEICTKLTIEYSIPDGIVEGRDLWAEEGVTDKDLSLHTLSADDPSLNLVVTYPKSVTVEGNFKDVDVCVTTPDRGLYHGALTYKTIQPGMIGIALTNWVIVDTTMPHFIKDEVKEISAFQTVLEITTNEDVSGVVEISEHEDLGNPGGKELLGFLIDINAPDIGDKLKSVTIKRYYTIEELDDKALNVEDLK